MRFTNLRYTGYELRSRLYYFCFSKINQLWYINRNITYELIVVKKRPKSFDYEVDLNVSLEFSDICIDGQNMYLESDVRDRLRKWSPGKVYVSLYEHR